MPVTYTNWRGVTYYLCRGVTKTGKPRYYFARQPKGEPVEEIPEGWKISESVNGVVSLMKDRPAQIRPSPAAWGRVGEGVHLAMLTRQQPLEAVELTHVLARGRQRVDR